MKVGDVVQLKSGGPKMTVTELGTGAPGKLNRDWAQCLYFSGDASFSVRAPFDALQPAIP